MEILLVAATATELQPFNERIKNAFASSEYQIDTLITGVGTLSASQSLQHRIDQKKPDRMIQIGIGGSFIPEHVCGSAVLIHRDRMADLGVMENGTFHDLYDLKLSEPNQYPFQNGYLVNSESRLFQSMQWPVCTGISVNEISTDPARMEIYRSKYDAAIESMEGAAFHYSALLNNIPFIQIRGISNKVGERNKKNWDIPGALHSAYDLLDWTLKNVL